MIWTWSGLVDFVGACVTVEIFLAVGVVVALMHDWLQKGDTEHASF
jgi:hypothetical protein